MNKILMITACVLLTGCNSPVSMPKLTEKAPDTLTQPTNTILSKETVASVPKGTWVKTDTEEKTEVVLEEDTLVLLQVEEPQDPKSAALAKPQQVILPKNTSVILPENTFLQTTDHSNMRIQPSSEVVLPPGTEISITKVNWYAILFYSLVVFLVAWHYLQLKREESTETKPTKKAEEKSDP